MNEINEKKLSADKLFEKNMKYLKDLQAMRSYEMWKYKYLKGYDYYDEYD